MKMQKKDSWKLALCGYIILGLGISGFASDYFTRLQYSLSGDMGIVLGDGAITLLGIITVTIAKCLKNLEQRLDRIEASK